MRAPALLVFILLIMNLGLAAQAGQLGQLGQLGQTGQLGLDPSLQVYKHRKYEWIHPAPEPQPIKPPSQQFYTIRPEFSERQWLWINAHWRDRAIYILVDRNGNVWIVGYGHYPKETKVKRAIDISMVDPGEPNAIPPPECGVYNTTAPAEAGFYVQLSGQVGGLAGLTLDWYVLNNTFAYVTWYDGFEYHNLTWYNVSEVSLAAGWSAQAPQDCQSPPQQNVITFTAQDPNDFPVRFGVYPASAIQNSLPDQPGTYYFILWEKIVFKRKVVNVTTIYRVLFIQVQINENANPPRNPIARALWSVGNWLKRGLEALAGKLVQAFNAILPDQIKQLASDVWQFFNVVLDVFKTGVSYLGQFSDFFKILVIFMPIVIIAIAVYDPFLVPSFFLWVLDIMRKTVSLIRALLPI